MDGQDVGVDARSQSIDASIQHDGVCSGGRFVISSSCVPWMHLGGAAPHRWPLEDLRRSDRCFPRSVLWGFSKYVLLSSVGSSEEARNHVM